MKKIVAVQFAVDPDRRYKVAIRSIEHLQEAYAEVIDELMKSFTGGTPSGGYILRGVTNTVAGASNTIAEGAIYFYMNFTAWNSVTAYTTGQAASRNGYSYAALQAGTNKDPDLEPTYWARLGKHQSGQVFLVDAQVIATLANIVVCIFDTTYVTGDPATFADQTTHNVHAIFKIKVKDDLTGTGIADFSSLNGGIQSDWVSVNSGDEYYRKDAFGWVHLLGTLGAVSGNVNFTLPAGFRPKTAQSFPGVWFERGVAPPTLDITTIDISTAGVVSCTANLSAGTSRNICLNGISFKADNNVL